MSDTGNIDNIDNTLRQTKPLIMVEFDARLSEARTCLEKYVKSEANAEMMTVLIRTLETLIDGKPTTPMRPHHHE